MEEDKPGKKWAALKTKHSVSKNHQEFTKLDKEWNEFKAKETSTGLGNIFPSLDEHLKNLKDFSARHKKLLKIIRKLEVSMLEGDKHVFTLFKTNEEHKKGTDV